MNRMQAEIATANRVMGQLLDHHHDPAWFGAERVAYTLADDGSIVGARGVLDEHGVIVEHFVLDPDDLPATARRAEAQPATRSSSRGRLLARLMLGALLWAGVVTALAGTPPVRDDLALVLLGVLISLGALMGLVELDDRNAP